MTSQIASRCILSLNRAQGALDVLLDARWQRCWSISFYDLAIHHEELCEIPSDGLHRLSSPILLFEPLEQWVGAISVDVHLAHHRKVGTHLIGKLLYLLIFWKLLVHELIGREAHNTKRAILELSLQLSEPLVIGLRQSAFASYISDEYDAFVAKLLPQADRRASCVGNFKIVQRRW